MVRLSGAARTLRLKMKYANTSKMGKGDMQEATKDPNSEYCSIYACLEEPMYGVKGVLYCIKHYDERRAKGGECFDSVVGKHPVFATTKPDMVNHPPHYTFGKYEVADADT